jgi:TPR repeat protein
MSAYYLAHKALSEGDKGQLLALLIAASGEGYAPAITDLGCLMLDEGDVQAAIRLFESAESRGDGEASFRLGEIAIKAGECDGALQKLRAAWSKGHQGALNTAHWLCTEMLKHGLGKSSRLKRELKEINFAIGKRLRYEHQTERASA